MKLCFSWLELSRTNFYISDVPDYPHHLWQCWGCSGNPELRGWYDQDGIGRRGRELHDCSALRLVRDGDAVEDRLHLHARKQDVYQCAGRSNHTELTASAVTYTISGNAGVAAATLSYVDGTTNTASADGAGNYAIAVPSGWSGTVTPSKTGYTFTPVSRPYTSVLADQTAQNYTASAVTYTLSGNTEVAGATLSYVDGTTNGADGAGNYTIAVPFGWSGTVTPAKTGYAFSPPSRTYTNVVADQITQDYTATAITSRTYLPLVLRLKSTPDTEPTATPSQTPTGLIATPTQTPTTSRLPRD